VSFETTREGSGHDDVFYHHVPPALAAEAQRREGDEASRALKEPWPLEAWPDVATIEADELDGGHYISVSRPRELAERLAAYADAR
jgi:hypothetical protein